MSLVYVIFYVNMAKKRLNKFFFFFFFNKNFIVIHIYKVFNFVIKIPNLWNYFNLKLLSNFVIHFRYLGRNGTKKKKLKTIE
jgi:hypothetical protein